MKMEVGSKITKENCSVQGNSRPTSRHNFNDILAKHMGRNWVDDADMTCKFIGSFQSQILLIFS